MKIILQWTLTLTVSTLGFLGQAYSNDDHLCNISITDENNANMRAVGLDEILNAVKSSQESVSVSFVHRKGVQGIGPEAYLVGVLKRDTFAGSHLLRARCVDNKTLIIKKAWIEERDRDNGGVTQVNVHGVIAERNAELGRVFEMKINFETFFDGPKTATLTSYKELPTNEEVSGSYE